MKLTRPELKLTGMAVVAGIALLSAMVAPATAQVLDQQQTDISYNFNADATWADWQQSITVGVAGQLVGVELYWYETPGSARVLLHEGYPWHGGAAVWETIVVVPTNDWVYLDTTDAGLTFDVGDVFTIRVQGVGDGLFFGGSRPSAGGPYPGGELWFEGSSYGDGVYDMAFKTYMGDGGGTVGDLDGDGDVDLADLAALLAVYGTCDGDPGYDPAADFDDSGCVDLADLAALLANYGT